MGLIICFACGHQRNVSPLKRQAYVCSNCGVKGPRLILRTKHWMDLSDRDGVSLEEAEHRTYGGLLGWGETKGFKKPRGYAYYGFIDIFGRQPNGARNSPAIAPSADLVWWIERRNARYARERRKLEKSLLVGSVLRVDVDGPAVVCDVGDSSLMAADDWGVKL